MGLFKDDKMVLDPRCMDEDTLKMIIKIEDLWSSGDVGGLFKNIPTVFKLAYVFDKTCDFNLLSYEAMQWAVNNGTS